MKNFALWIMQRSGVLALKRARTQSAFRIVTYHGVDERDHPVLNVDRLQTSPTLFAKQIEALARQYQIVGLETTVRAFLETGTWPERGLAITFDDGYRNNLEQAAPILTRLGIPATFFVTASFVDGRSSPWWYALREWLTSRYPTSEQAAAEALKLEAEWRPLSEKERAQRFSELKANDSAAPIFYPFMNREEVKQLSQMGFDIQPHGDAHLSFRGESFDRIQQDIEGSVRFVREVTGHDPWGFAYPYGHLPVPLEPVQSLFERYGILAAVSTREGNNDAQANRWALNRWDLHGGYSVPAVSARVAGIRRSRRDEVAS